MPGSETSDAGPSERLAVREPRQARTREQWARILDAGVALVEDEGYDGFTIATLCERAGVAPRALYARADTKDALFMAVYEHGMGRVVASEQVFDDVQRWRDRDEASRIDQAIDGLVHVFRSNERFLRSIVLISGAHPDVLSRGQRYQARIRARFVAAVTGVGVPGGATAGVEVDLATRRAEFCFGVVFSTLVVMTAYAGFSAADEDDSALVELKVMARSYLLA